MAIYLVSGRLGSGKSLASVGRIREAALQGRRIATNLNLNLDNLFPARSKCSVVRVPDKPTVADLDALGLGNELMDESKNGLLVLDECGSFLNSRDFQDKSRAPLIDWLIHSRKKGWDVLFLIQHLDMVDKQIRTALVEYLVVCKRMDRLKIPFFGGFLKLLGLHGNLPQIHVGTVFYGTERNAPVADTWWYMAKGLYAAYETRQIFSSTYDKGNFSYLSAWHLKGRFLPPASSKFDVFVLWLLGPVPARPIPKPKHSLINHILSRPGLTKDQQWRLSRQLFTAK